MYAKYLQSLTMSKISDIIDELGGSREVSRALGHKNPSTVQGWKSRESVPQWQMTHLLDLAESKGKSITADDLLPTSGDEAAA